MKTIRLLLLAIIGLGFAAGMANATSIVVQRPSHALNPQPEVPSKPKPQKSKKSKPHH